MKYGLSINNLNKILIVLRQFSAIESVYLYGSRAKGNYKRSSDIDLMLKGEQLNLKQLTGVMAALDELLLPYQFDVAIYNQINNSELLEHVDRVGIDLYNSVVLTSS